MPLSGLDYRQHEGSYAEDPTDMWRRYAGEVCHGQGRGRQIGAVHIRQQTQVERDLSEDGAEDSGSLEDGSGQISASGRADLHEARSMMDRQAWITSVVILAVILIANLGGLYLIGAI